MKNRSHRHPFRHTNCYRVCTAGPEGGMKNRSDIPTHAWALSPCTSTRSIDRDRVKGGDSRTTEVACRRVPARVGTQHRPGRPCCHCDSPPRTSTAELPRATGPAVIDRRRRLRPLRVCVNRNCTTRATNRRPFRVLARVFAHSHDSGTATADGKASAPTSGLGIMVVK